MLFSLTIFLFEQKFSDQTLFKAIISFYSTNKCLFSVSHSLWMPWCELCDLKTEIDFGTLQAQLFIPKSWDLAVQLTVKILCTYHLMASVYVRELSCTQKYNHLAINTIKWLTNETKKEPRFQQQQPANTTIYIAYTNHTTRTICASILLRTRWKQNRFFLNIFFVVWSNCFMLETIHMFGARFERKT